MVKSTNFRRINFCYSVVVLFLILLGCTNGTNDQEKVDHVDGNNRDGNKLKVLVLGIDGFEPSLFDTFLHKGMMPNLETILRNGSRAKVKTEFILSSPVIWTSIATGVVPKVHGITNFTIKGKPVNSSFRKVPAFWNIFPNYGIKSLTLGWWATWPAEKNAGIMIGSRVFWAARPNKVYPPDIIDTNSYDMGNFIDNYDFLNRFTDYPYEPNYKDKYNPTDNRFVVNKLIRQRLIKAYYRDKIYTDIAVELAQKENPEVMAIYLQGVDYVSHAFWQYMDPLPFRKSGAVVDKREVSSMGRIIPEYYKYTDELIGKLIPYCDENTYIFVLADHGFGPDPSLLNNREELGLSGNHRPETLFILSGPEVVKHQNFGQVTPQKQVDFLPTLFYLLGIPVAQDFAGTPQMKFFNKKFREEMAVSHVGTYKNLYKKSNIVSSKQDKKVLSNLRGLGYIK